MEWSIGAQALLSTYDRQFYGGAPPEPGPDPRITDEMALMAARVVALEELASTQAFRADFLEGLVPPLVRMSDADIADVLNQSIGRMSFPAPENYPQIPGSPVLLAFTGDASEVEDLAHAGDDEAVCFLADLVNLRGQALADIRRERIAARRAAPREVSDVPDNRPPEVTDAQLVEDMGYRRADYAVLLTKVSPDSVMSGSRLMVRGTALLKDIRTTEMEHVVERYGQLMAQYAPSFGPRP
ncbi:hypothetical protein AD929_03700 [Gluconobacter potus]|uniref:Uncharacterized protein n=2 Tax=Gluconobacter potus TaxID=2724927 RepID=A0A149QY32_9PROT|nr:hypothetical protein AD929_03700 [Gluconobacter potus]